MKNKSTIIISFFAFILTSGCASNNDNLPAGAIQKGSLSNQQLIKDTMVGVYQKMAVLGCTKPESYEPYVVSMPKGNVGSRIWRELWVVKGCNTNYPVYITFSEDGLSAANYIVE